MPKHVPADTTPEASRVERDILRRLGPRARVQMAFDLSDELRDRVAAGIRSRHPELDEVAVQRAAVRLWIGEELFRMVCNDAGPAH